MRRCDNGGRLSFWSRPVVLVFLSVLLIPHTSLAPRLCIASSSLAAVSEAGSHAADAYSSTGQTRCLYAVAFTCSDVVRTLRLMNLSKELPLDAVLLTWAFQFVFVSKVTPRYLIWSAFGIIVL